MNHECLSCNDTGSIEGVLCTCRIGRALLDAQNKIQVDRERVASLGEKAEKELNYFEKIAERWAQRAHGMSFQEVQEKKVKELLDAMKHGRVSTRQFFHERDREKLSDRFGLWGSDDFVPDLVSADEFRKYYPKHEGNTKVRVFRLNPEKYGPPGPEIKSEDFGLFSQPTTSKPRGKK